MVTVTLNNGSIRKYSLSAYDTKQTYWNAVVEYCNGDENKKREIIINATSMLKAHLSGMDNIGFGIAPHLIEAAKMFLRYIQMKNKGIIKMDY